MFLHQNGAGYGEEELHCAVSVTATAATKHTAADGKHTVHGHQIGEGGREGWDGRGREGLWGGEAGVQGEREEECLWVLFVILLIYVFNKSHSTNAFYRKRNRLSSLC